MIHPQVEKLLTVQEKDLSLQKLQSELDRIPQQRMKIEAAIAEERAAIEAARTDLNEKEIARKDLDAQVQNKELDVSKFKNQQLEVKKNEEYRALTSQIEQAKSDIATLEEAEINLMYSIDEAREAFEASKGKIEERIVEQGKAIEQLEERLAELNRSIEGSKQAYHDSRTGVDGCFLEDYDRVKTQVKRAPYIVAIEGQNCTGCHLRVSNEVFGLASNGEGVVICDQCPRIVYRK